MKLLNCYIENFGKLQNYKYDFKNGLNIINEKNGFGKTTFATFIKSMFYGLDAGTNVKTEKSERKKYYPWQGGNYGGYIEFEIEGKRYRIERFFGKKQVEDTFKLYDLTTNLESSDYTENIGEEIFKINKSAYERSTYIPQGQIKIDMEDSLSAKLGNILESDNDINTSDEAIKRLNEAKKVYIKDKGKSGIIDEKKKKLNMLERKLENSKSDFESLEIKKNKFKEITNNLTEQEKLREEGEKILSAKIEQGRKLAKIENYNSITKKYEQTKETLDYLKDFFKDEIPLENTIKNLNAQNTELEKIKNVIENSKLSNVDLEILDSLKEKFDGKNINEEEINQAISNCYEVPELEKEIQIKQKDIEQKQKEIKKKRKIYIFLNLIGALIIIAGIIIIAIKTKQIVGIAITALGVVIFIIGLILLLKNKKLKEINLNNELQQLEKHKHEIEMQVYGLLKRVESNTSNKPLALSNLKSQFSQYNELLNKQVEKDMNLQKNIIKKSAIESEIRQKLNKYFNSFNGSYMEQIQELNVKKNEYDSILKQFEEAKNEKEKFEKENNMQLLQETKDMSDISELELKEKITVINNKINILLDEKNQLKNQIEILENQIDENEYLETDIQNLKEDIIKLNDKYKIINKTEQLLQTAKEKFSSSYLQDMIKGFNNYLKILNEDDLKTNVDIKLDVKIDVKGSQKEIKYFSSGYKDLIYICMRFSLIKALFKDEAPFVVLDDPFVNLDEEKTKKALEVINEISKEYQIIYFVCNSSRV